MKRALTTLSLLLCFAIVDAQEVIMPPTPSKMTQKKSIPPAKGTAPTASPKEKEDKVYDIVEQQPLFPGGPAALMKFLCENTRYPETAQEAQVQGRVTVQFVVEKDGSLSDVRVLKRVDPSLDLEAIRVVKAMPRWTPGKQNGATVRVRYRVPVLFRLQ